MDPKGAIEKFRQITGSDEPTANFYMEANRWDIAQATESYFEAGGESVPASTAANAASAKSSMSSPSPATATSKPSSSRIATFKDLSRGGGGSDHDDDEDNDDNEEGPEYYAGGEKS